MGAIGSSTRGRRNHDGGLRSRQGLLCVCSALLHGTIVELLSPWASSIGTTVPTDVPWHLSSVLRGALRYSNLMLELELWRADERAPALPGPQARSELSKGVASQTRSCCRFFNLAFSRP